MGADLCEGGVAMYESELKLLVIGRTWSNHSDRFWFHSSYAYFVEEPIP